MNDVLGLAGEDGVGLNVSGGRNLEDERMGKGLDEGRPVWGMVPPEPGGVRAKSTNALSDGIVMAV